MKQASRKVTIQAVRWREILNNSPVRMPTKLGRAARAAAPVTPLGSVVAMVVAISGFSSSRVGQSQEDLFQILRVLADGIRRVARLDQEQIELASAAPRRGSDDGVVVV